MIDLRLMTAADIPAAMRLCGQAGWNQTAADWQRFRHFEPEGCFVAERDGSVVGTTTTTIFGKVAWLAMVLVEESLRGHGIGTALVRRALEFLDRQSVATVRLDATALGRPLYQRLGFALQFELARYAGIIKEAASGAAVAPVVREHLGLLALLDEAVTHTDRRRLLQRLFEEHPTRARSIWNGGQPEGYLLSRPGTHAEQLGPCIASPAAGPLLFTDACRRYRRQKVFVDIPVANESAARLAKSHGLSIQRSLTRMCRGMDRIENLQWLWASSGPEKG
jgi:predicted N-acetyltransferase YhbS